MVDKRGDIVESLALVSEGEIKLASVSALRGYQGVKIGFRYWRCAYLLDGVIVPHTC